MGAAQAVDDDDAVRRPRSDQGLRSGQDPHGIAASGGLKKETGGRDKRTRSRGPAAGANPRRARPVSGAV